MVFKVIAQQATVNRTSNQNSRRFSTSHQPTSPFWGPDRCDSFVQPVLAAHCRPVFAVRCTMTTHGRIHVPIYWTFIQIHILACIGSDKPCDSTANKMLLLRFKKHIFTTCNWALQQSDCKLNCGYSISVMGVVCIFIPKPIQYHIQPIRGTSNRITNTTDNNDKRSRYLLLPWKSSKYYILLVCVCICEYFLRSLILLYVACLRLFSHYLTNDTIFGKRVIKYKMCSDFL
jgi:hypothetical protein